MTAQVTPANQSSSQLDSAEFTLSRPPRSLWRDAWARLLKNKAAVGGAIVIIIFCVLALFAPIFAPYNPGKKGLQNLLSHPERGSQGVRHHG